MKRLLAALFLALVASLALAVNAASATHSNGQGPNQDLTAGTGQMSTTFGLEVKIHVNAMSGPSGEEPRGHFRVEQLFPLVALDNDVRGRVTCLNVVGKKATVGGEIVRSNNPNFPEGSGILIWVDDDDEGEGDENTTFFVDTPPQTCPSPIEPFQPNTQGNFIVHDAT